MRITLALAALATLGAASPAYRYALDGPRSAVTAKVSYLGLGSKTARFPVMQGTLRIVPERLSDLDLTVDLDARALMGGSPRDTASLRGKDFFDVARFPTVSFSGHRLTMTGPLNARLDGAITARGITRPASLAVTFAQPPARATGRDPIQLRAATVIDRRAFGMTAYGWAVGRSVAITIDARMVPD